MRESAGKNENYICVAKTVPHIFFVAESYIANDNFYTQHFEFSNFFLDISALLSVQKIDVP